MVAIDATTLMLLLRPGAKGPAGVTRVKERVEYFVVQQEKTRTRILVPTPALSEVLVRAGVAASGEIVDELNRHGVFRVEPFDQRAAIEVAAMTRAELDGGRPKKLKPTDVWAKVKYDRQIVAIALVNRVDKLYSDDGDIRAIALRANLPVVGIAELPLPPGDPNLELPFPPQIVR